MWHLRWHVQSAVHLVRDTHVPSQPHSMALLRLDPVSGQFLNHILLIKSIWWFWDPYTINVWKSKDTWYVTFPHHRNLWKVLEEAIWFFLHLQVEMWFNCFPDKLLLTLSFSPNKRKLPVILSPHPPRIPTKSLLWSNVNLSCLTLFPWSLVLMRVEKYLSHQKTTITHSIFSLPSQ